MPNTMVPLRSAVIKSPVVFLFLAEDCHNVRKDTYLSSDFRQFGPRRFGFKLNNNEPIIHHVASTSFVGNCSYCRSPAC